MDDWYNFFYGIDGIFQDIVTFFAYADERRNIFF